MTNYIKDQIAILTKLQALDNETQTLHLSLNDVDSQVGELENRLENFEQTCRKTEADLETLRKTYRECEREVQNIRSKAEKSHEKTRSVKTNKEYQSLLKEIDDLKVKASDMEDEMLELLEQIEKKEIDFAKQQKELNLLKVDIAQQKEAIVKEADNNRTALLQHQKQREIIVAELAPEILKHFNKVRAKVGILTIAAVKEFVCKGCHVNIPPQLFNELQRADTLIQCPNCQRIIYFYDPKKRSE